LPADEWSRGAVDIVAYLRMLRRHWKLVAALTVVGGILGAATSLATSSGSADTRRYFKASHTLFLDTSGLDTQARPIYTNLDQIAVLATTGDVPRRVAAKLGGDVGTWTAKIYTVSNGATNTLDITCAEPSADDAVTCADTFAEELIASLEERETSRFNAQRDETFRRLDTLQTQINTLDTQIAGRPANLDILQAQRNSLVNQYRLTYEKLQQLAEQGGPASIVSTLESADAEPRPNTTTGSRWDDWARTAPVPTRCRASTPRPQPRRRAARGSTARRRGARWVRSSGSCSVSVSRSWSTAPITASARERMPSARTACRCSRRCRC
jgi:hypothetical protein